MLCEHARKATTVVPKRYCHRHRPPTIVESLIKKVTKQCTARTVRHPKKIKGHRHVPGPIRKLASLSYTTMAPIQPPYQVLSLGLQDLVRLTVLDS